MLNEIEESLSDKVKRLQDILIARATGGGADDEEYRSLRQELLTNSIVGKIIPSFVRSCRDLGQFWSHVKPMFPTYADRRSYLWSEFQQVSEAAEKKAVIVEDVDGTLSKLSSENVQELWKRALERRMTDPASAITLARTLIESVLKHVLDDAHVIYNDDEKLPKLYGLVAAKLNLAPSQHTEEAFKQILGGCASVIQGLGVIRSRIGDSHGQGRKQFRPAQRHAGLAVNLAGSMALSS